MKVTIIELNETDDAGYNHWIINAVYFNEEKAKEDIRKMIENGRAEEDHIRIRDFEVIE